MSSYTDRESLIVELSEHARNLDIINRLGLYGNALNAIEDVQATGGHYFLLILNPTAQTIRVRGFFKNQLKLAQDEYLEIEKKISDKNEGTDAVLVSVDSTAALKRAYPNYFLDTRIFLGVVQDAIQGRRLEVQEN